MSPQRWRDEKEGEREVAGWQGRRQGRRGEEGEGGEREEWRERDREERARGDERVRRRGTDAVPASSQVPMRDARELHPPASLDALGFALQSWPTKCDDFEDDDAVVATYYGEMMDLVKAASGAERVFIFDHTVRESGNTNLNAAAGGSAAPVPRVHCDYTASGAPRRLQQLGAEGIYSRLRGRVLTCGGAEAGPV